MLRLMEISENEAYESDRGEIAEQVGQWGIDELELIVERLRPNGTKLRNLTRDWRMAPSVATREETQMLGLEAGLVKVYHFRPFSVPRGHRVGRGSGSNQRK